MSRKETFKLVFSEFFSFGVGCVAKVRRPEEKEWSEMTITSFRVCGNNKKEVAVISGYILDFDLYSKVDVEIVIRKDGSFETTGFFENDD
ncbi:hypothetical protein C0583_05425 [Candidatus Parcubacteria bacterium]|nr:MAG: hypothetical protein C0583_05425 [Candidatus Parcubacteria bacterium]